MTRETGRADFDSNVCRLASVDELHQTFPKVKDGLTIIEMEIRTQMSKSNSEIQSLESTRIACEDRQNELKQQLATIEVERAQAERRLSVLKKERNSWEAGTGARKQELAQAMKDLEFMSSLARDVADRFRGTTFKSQNAVMDNLIQPLWREFVEKYVGADRLLPLHVLGASSVIEDGLEVSIKRKLLSILHDLKYYSYHWIFEHPVTEDIAPGYFEVIKKPMDLSVMRAKLKADEYISMAEFFKDLRLMFDNCRNYNAKHSFYVDAANTLEEHMRCQMESRGLREL